MTFLEHGESEGVKGAVHACALGLAVVMGIYNGAAFVQRRQRHLAVNGVLYGLAAWWEYQQVRKHWTDC